MADEERILDFRFSTALHRVMVDIGITPAELARRAKIPSTAAVGLLRGRVPRAHTLLKIVDALGLQGNPEVVRELFGGAVLSRFLRSSQELHGEGEVREGFMRAVHGYFGTLVPGRNISPRAYSDLFPVWTSLLPPDALPRDEQNEPTESQLHTLTPPPIVVVSEWREIVSQIGAGSLKLTDLGWRQFEDLVARLLEQFGWEVTPMGYTKDEGVDIVAVRKVSPDINFSMMVQCKRYSDARKVGVEVVREVWSVKWAQGFQQAMIATTSSFTRGARHQATEWKLELRDSDVIREWCAHHGGTTVLR
ncbi:MAG: restriction endonuclease [Acidobacteria bacterium]|nr:restriction endonuclease [Acidobacteriota bacterium]